MEKLTKSEQAQYNALERRVTDIFNGCTGNGYTADEWVDNEWFTAKDIGTVMSAIEKTWGEALKEKVFVSFKLSYVHCEYFDQPKQATEWLWTLGVKE